MPAGIFTVWLVVPKVSLSTLVVAFVQEHAPDIPFRVFWFTVVWTKANPVPRNTIEQDQNIKIMSVGHKFDGGRFVSAPHPHTCADRLMGLWFCFAAGSVPVGEIDATSARTHEDRNFLFLLHLMSIATSSFLHFSRVLDR